MRRETDSHFGSTKDADTHIRTVKLPRSAPLKLLTIIIFLSEKLTGQIARVNHFYPNAGTFTPYDFAFPVSNGFFLKDFTTYVHGERSGAAPSIRALRKDASVIQVTANNALNSYSLNFYNDHMTSFGATASIIKYKFDYAFPGFFVLLLTESVGHNNNFYMAAVDPSSGMHYISTTTGQKVFKYSDADLTVQAGMVVFADVAFFSVLNFMQADKLILAGRDSKIKFTDKISLAETVSYTSACNPANAIINVLYDSIHVPVTEYRIDAACDSLLTRYSFDAGTLIKKEEVGPFTLPVTNLMEFKNHNYLMVTYDDTIEIVKRSTYLASQGFKQLLVSTVNTYSYGCCEVNKHKFTFSATSGVAPIRFKSLTVSLDFCSNYDGEVCTECNSGFKLQNSDPGNTCISPDEYPPRFGAKGSLIAECKDANCKQCIDAFYKCEVCNAPYYINMDSYECSDLLNISLFGKDTANSSIIRRCSDTNCLFCKDDFTKCTLCQEEYFDLRSAACVAKDANLTIEKTWFNQSESKGYIQFSGGFQVDPSKLFPKNITMTLLDNQNDTYTDYTDFEFSGDKTTGLLIVSIKLQTSIYGGIMLFNQTAKSPVFYNAYSYMAPTVEFNITNIRQIRASTYFLIESIESPIQVGIWVVMIFSTLFGSIFHPLFGTLLMKTICVMNLLSHLDGPALHTSDLFLDVVGKISLPIKALDEALRMSESNMDCIPEDNFSKRYQGYASCSIFDMYGKSILFFTIGMTIGLPLSIMTFVKLKALREKLTKDIKAVIDPGLPKLVVFNRWFGIRLLSAIMYATAPLYLQYSYMSIVSGGAPVIAMIFGCMVVGLYLTMVYADFRFTYFFLDFLHIQDLKRLPKNELTHEMSFNSDQQKMPKGMNVVFPKKADMVPFTTKDGKIKMPANLNDSNLTNDKSKNVSGLMDSSHDQSTINLLENTTKRQLKIDLEIMRNKYGFLYYFVQGFKNKASAGRTLFFYFPLVELLSILVNCYVLVRFSGDGLVQVYVISVFEMLTTFLFTVTKPYESKLDYYLMLTHRYLVSMILFLKMFNFIVMPEEASRQKIVDTLTLMASVLLLIYATGVAVYSLVKAVRLMCSFTKIVAEEALVIEEERVELQEKIGKEKIPSEKPQEPSIESKSISGLSDSPARRDLPKGFLSVDKIARANKLTLKNKEKIFADNLKLFQNETIKEDPAAEDRENDIDDLKFNKPAIQREAPVVETLEVTKKTEGIFTTVKVTNDLRKPADNKVAPKPIVSVLEGQYLNPVLPQSSFMLEGNSFNSRFLPNMNVSISKPKKQDKFASMLEGNKLEEQQDSNLLLHRYR